MKKYIQIRIPLVETLKGYNSRAFKGDLNAGIIVAVLLIPQAMAYAVLAGLPPVYGLYASIIPLVVYALLGSSRQLAIGPVAIVSLLVFAGVGQLAEIGSDRFIQLAILTAFGVGVVQLLMGLFRMGFLVNFLSHPVISGFTSAAAVIIAASQLGNLLGIELEGGHQIHEILMSLAANLSGLHLLTAVVGGGSILLLYLLKRWKKTFPAALTVVAAGTAITAIFNLPALGLEIVGDVPRGLPSLESPAFLFSDFQALIPLILVISLVGFVESYAVAKAVANKRGYNIDSNQELIALGGANLAGSFFQSYPTTGGFSRTAVNDLSGAKTPLASIITAALIGLTVLLLTPLFYYLPNAILAAIIIVAVIGLFDAKEMVHLWKTDRKDLAMLLVTFIATLTLGVEEGILTGVVISLIMVIYSSTTPHYAELGRLGETKNYRNIRRYEEAHVDREVLIYRFDSPLYFANVEHFRATLEEKMKERGEDLNLVILDASAIHQIDSTGIHMLEELIKDLQVRRIDFYLAGPIGPVRDQLKRCGIFESMEDSIFFDVADAVEFYNSKSDKHPGYPWSPAQTNF